MNSPNPAGAALRTLAGLVGTSKLNFPTDRLPQWPDPVIRVNLLDDRADQARGAALTAALEDKSAEEWTAGSGCRYRTTRGRLLTMHLEVIELLPEDAQPKGDQG